MSDFVVRNVTIVGTIYCVGEGDITGVTVVPAMSDRRPWWMPQRVQRLLLRLVTVPAAMPTDAAVICAVPGAASPELAA